MRRLFWVYVLIMFFLAGCISKPVSEISFLKQSSILTIEPYTSKAIGMSENQFVASTNKLEIEDIVTLIAESKDLKLNKSKINNLSKENSYYINFKITSGNNAGEYSYIYFPKESILLLSDTKKVIAVSVEGQLKTKFDNFINHQMNAIDKQTAPKGTAPTAFITLFTS